MVSHIIVPAIAVCHRQILMMKVDGTFRCPYDLRAQGRDAQVGEQEQAKS